VLRNHQMGVLETQRVLDSRIHQVLWYRLHRTHIHRLRMTSILPGNSNYGRHSTSILTIPAFLSAFPCCSSQFQVWTSSHAGPHLVAQRDRSHRIAVCCPKTFGLDYISLNLVSFPFLALNVSFCVFRLDSTSQLLWRALRSSEIDDIDQEKI
jgi:hypothetical protein